MNKKLYQSPSTVIVDIKPISILCASTTKDIYIDPNPNSGLVGG